MEGGHRAAESDGDELLLVEGRGGLGGDLALEIEDGAEGELGADGLDPLLDLLDDSQHVEERHCARAPDGAELGAEPVRAEARRGARVLEERDLAVGRLERARLVDAVELEAARPAAGRAAVEVVAVGQQRAEQRAQGAAPH